MTTDSSLRYRRAVEEDTGSICALLKQAFDDNPKTDPTVFRWQYRDNPFGQAASWVAEDSDGVVVAHAGLYPVPGRIEGTEHTIGHAADAATALPYRGHGVYETLSRLRLDQAARTLPASMILPNHHSRAAAVRSGVVLRHRVRAHIHLPVTPMVRLRGPRAYEVTVDDLPEGLTALARRCDPDRNGILRSAEWIHWRYVHHPTRRFRYFLLGDRADPRAFAVTGVIHRRWRSLQYVMELTGVSAAAAVEVLRAVLRSAERKPTVMLSTPGSLATRAAVRAGLLPLPHLLDPQPQYLGLHAGSLGLRAPWLVSWGDHDQL